MPPFDTVCKPISRTSGIQEVKLVTGKHSKAVQLLKSIGYADVAINSIEGQRGVLTAI